MSTDRLQKQLAFLIELDKMKNLYRQTYIANDDLPTGSTDFEANFKERRPLPRKENDAEHSFSLALAAAVLAEHSNVEVDVGHVIKMVLVHDVVEIDAGDTYCYDTEGYKTKRARELAAADRLFGILPEDQCAEFRALWDEFEANVTADAHFANALDRLQPLLLNYTREGISWREHGVGFEQVKERNSHIGDASEELWNYFLGLLTDAEKKGWLK